MPAPVDPAAAAAVVEPLLAAAAALALRGFRCELDVDDTGGGVGADPLTEAVLRARVTQSSSSDLRASASRR
jgi:hypothetical protein